MGDLTDGHKHTFVTETMLAVSQIRVAEFVQILLGVFRNSSWPIDVILDHPKCGHPCGHPLVTHAKKVVNHAATHIWVTSQMATSLPF